MKRITITIEEDFYDQHKRSSLEHGDKKATTIEDWKREHRFGKYGRRRNLSHLSVVNDSEFFNHGQM